MRNIHEWGLEIKGWTETGIHEWGLVAILFLLALVSFGLGRLSVLEGVMPPVAITEAPKAAVPSARFMGGLFVASRSGNVYYYPWCAGAGKIAPSSQVWFSSETEARQAGYAPARACTGLGN